MNSKQLDKTRALAGVFQAAQLVQRLATSGTVNQTAYETSIRSIFIMDPENVSDVYQSDDHLFLGLSILEEIFSTGQTQQNIDTIRYALNLVQVENMLRKQPDLLNILRNRLEHCSQQVKHVESYTHESVISQLASIYVDTMGTFKYRIQVKGDPRILQQDVNSNKVRAILLSGVRSAMLWRQLGGRRWHLMFSRAKHLQSVQALKH